MARSRADRADGGVAIRINFMIADLAIRRSVG
jgi:hypothetical protein